MWIQPAPCNSQMSSSNSTFSLNSRSHFQLPTGFQNQRCPTGEPTSNRLNWVPFSRNLLLHSHFHLSAKGICSVQSSQAILSYFSPTTHPPTKTNKNAHKVLPPLIISTFYSDYSSLDYASFFMEKEIVKPSISRLPNHCSYQSLQDYYKTQNWLSYLYSPPCSGSQPLSR